MLLRVLMKKKSIRYYHVSPEHHRCLVRKFAYYCHLVKKTVEAQGANSGYNSVYYISSGLQSSSSDSKPPLVAPRLNEHRALVLISFSGKMKRKAK